MIRGFCLAVDEDTGRMCGKGMATYIDLERGCTVCDSSRAKQSTSGLNCGRQFR
jgi:hypothetical protein